MKLFKFKVTGLEAQPIVPENPRTLVTLSGIDDSPGAADNVIQITIGRDEVKNFDFGRKLAVEFHRLAA